MQPLLSKKMVTTVPLNRVTVVGMEAFVPVVLVVLVTGVGVYMALKMHAPLVVRM